MHTNENNNTRLDDIINMLIEYSQGNFDIRLTVTEEDDALNTVASGLNMLGEELAHYEKQITENRDFLQNILSSIDEVVYAMKINPEKPSESQYTFVNGRTEEILGIPTRQLMEQPSLWINAIHPDDAKYTSGLIDNLLQGNDQVFSYRVFHKTSGEYIWIEDRVMPKKDSNGVVTEIYGSARNITSLKQANIELQQKNELVSRIVSTSDQFFYIVKVDEQNSFANNFSYHSWQIEDIQGSTAEDIKNNPMGWVEAVHPDDMPRIKAYNRQMFSAKKPVMRIYRVKHKHTGEYIWLEDYVVPVANADGRIRELYGSVRDISARKKDELEKERLIKELNDKVNEAMQFNYIVSHNLRAPVANIIGLAELLNMDMPADDLKTTLQYITEAAFNMDELLNDLNTILSARSNLNEKIEPVLLDDVIHTVCMNLKKEINLSKAIIDKNIHASAATVHVIKSYMQSILFNLISNALKYRADDRPPHINITAEKQSDRTIIKVADNGIGIDLEKHGENIFGIYNRFHLAREGKGLGLHMTKTQVEALGGTITVESTPGVGTTFTVIL